MPPMASASTSDFCWLAQELYEILGDSGLYPFANPLVHADAKSAIAEFRRGNRTAMLALAGRPPMPPSSGVDPPEDIRLSENYFRLVRREWQPHSIDDPEFPSRVYAAGERFGWALREVCVARTCSNPAPEFPRSSI